jgi:hypothetical protein
MIGTSARAPPPLRRLARFHREKPQFLRQNHDTGALVTRRQSDAA